MAQIKKPVGTIPHAGEQQVIQRILSYRANGQSFKKIAAQMTSMGVLTKSGKTKWHPMNIKRIIDSIS
ncbi:MAG: recombinase family protein [Bacteriovoracaceae bacterium]